MPWDDLRKLIVGPKLYRLDQSIAPRLVPLFYALGLAGIGLWAIDHLVASFAFDFGQGLWGIIEIIVYVPLAIIVLRIVAEAVIVFFNANPEAAAGLGRRPSGASLSDEVSAAIRELAEDDDTRPTAPPSAS